MELATEPKKRSLTLPSGKTVTIREGRGRDLMFAQRAVKPADGPGAVIFALIADLTEFDDGKQPLYEDVLEMPLADVLVLQSAVMEDAPGGLPSPVRSPA
jgi:hypothetical protein